MNLFADRLRNTIQQGTLTIIDRDGAAETFGSGEPRATMRFTDGKALPRLLLAPELMLGQLYMDRRWELEAGTLEDLLQILMRNFPDAERRRGWRRHLIRLRQPLQQWNGLQISRRNVETHYNLDETLFRAFLDRDMHYSCAYFPSGEEADLDTAQQAKCEHIARKLLLRPGQKVLDIGCGWGSLAMYLAEKADVSVTGLTLSPEQKRVADQRVAERRLQDRVRILLEDYREHTEVYDRVVSVGMFEHVGVPYYRRYFGTLHRSLVPDGIGLVHTIGRTGPPAVTNSWIRQHIFPGGYVPALSEVMPAVENAGLVTADIEVLRMHYAFTLAAWQARFQAQRSRFVESKGERFCRLWGFYLAASEAAFRWRDLVVFQLQLGRENAVVPTTRDYLHQGERTADAPTHADRSLARDRGGA